MIEDDLRTYPGKPTKQWFLKFQIVAGQYAGETHLDSTNLVTGAGEVNKGGQKFVENLFNACGHVGKIIDTKPIIGKPFTAKLDLKDSDKINEKTGKPYKNNVMVGHYKIGQAPKATAQESAPATGGSTESKAPMKW